MRTPELSLEISHRLLDNYNTTTKLERGQGANWYRAANEITKSLAARYDVSPSQVAAVIAVLSPGNEWMSNVSDAREYIACWRGIKPLPTVGVYGKTNTDKALRILEGETPLNVVSGPKVTSFYHCIMNPKDSYNVVIDRQAKRIALGTVLTDSESVVRASEYNWYADHYRAVAMHLKVAPCVLQATLASGYRRVVESGFALGVGA